MNPDEEIQALEELLEELLRGIQEVLQSGEVLSDEFQGMLAQEIEVTTARIDQIRQEQANQPEPLPEQPPIEPGAQIGNAPTPSAQLMWILAGQNVDAFVHYIHNFPDPELNALLNNPGELDRVINYLNQMMPKGDQPSADGIPHADLNSSNIYGFRYNPKDGKLKVRFQSGSVYEYDNVPPNTFNAFRQGSAAAKTTGQNQFGRWWRGKNPSLGAAFWDYIRNAGFDYRRLR